MSPLVRALAIMAIALATAAPSADARSWSWLGVRIRDLSEQEVEEISARHGIREGFGVVIVEVIADTPAARAGMKSGDVVVAFGERPVVETRLLQRLIAAAPVDREASLTVLRAEGRRALNVRLTTMPPAVAGERVAAEFGFSLREPSPPAEPGGPRPTRALELSGSGSALPTVGAVSKGSAAEKAGLEVGDVIIAVAERPIVTGDAAREALAEREPDRPLPLTVRRGDRRLSLTLSP
ncbi:MAG TPA: PDZ domain-containing protein [Candidatus Acidoferrum sp.]|nr:PDZ domain-containing protein [Candidatus Acidoferrum sp.]